MKCKDCKFMKILPLLAQSLVGIALVFILWLIVKELPMLAGIPFSLRFSLNQLVAAPILLFLAGLIINLAIKVEGRLKGFYPRTPQWGQLAKSVGFVLGIYIAYLALQPLIVPYTANLGWIYHSVFLAGFVFFLGLAIFQVFAIVQKELPPLLGEELPQQPAQPAAGPRCQSCGAVLKPGAKFCPACGASVVQAPAPAAALVCVSCGKALVIGAKFCPGCGLPVSTETAAAAEPGPPVCVSCKAVLKAGTKFCPECGASQE